MGQPQYFNCGALPTPAIPASPTVDYDPTYDNFFVQHQIPRSTRQYAWITGSVANYNEAWTPSFTPRNFLVATGSTLINAYDFVSASEAGSAGGRFGVRFGDPWSPGVYTHRFCWFEHKYC